MIDFHCHLDLFPDPQDVAARCENEGIYVLSVTTTPSAWQGTSALERGRIRTALGLHPQLAHERISELELFDEILPRARYVGEIGLDGAPEFKKTSDQQLQVFRHVLASCTKAGGRILSLHSRRAAAAVLDELALYPDAGTPVLHWFSGSGRQVARAVQAGCWFSVGPPMLRSANGRKIISMIPRDRILTESDGPFAQLDDAPVYPWDMPLVLAGLAELWSSDQSCVRSVLLENLKRLTGKA